jgi:hypothetical protein
LLIISRSALHERDIYFDKVFALFLGMLKKYFFSIFIASSILLACKSKKEDDKKTFFPVLSFIQSQVAHVDTSLYPIVKLTYIDSTRTDTQYIKREDFRSIAKDFLELPDLSKPKFKKRFINEERYDETLGRVIFTVLPVNPDKEQIQRQEVIINNAGNDVNSIYIDFFVSSKDSSVEKKLFWRADRSFQVTTIKQKPGMAETITTSKVIWNEPADQ